MHSMPIVVNVKIAICLISSAATVACHFTSGRRVCTPPSCPGHARCMRVGGGGFELPVRKQSVNENQTKFDYQLITGC